MRSLRHKSWNIEKYVKSIIIRLKHKLKYENNNDLPLCQKWNPN